jgi:septum formation protein
VLAADTVVVAGGRVLGKPEDEADARRMLAELSGRTHAVVTGVCWAAGAARAAGLERTEVTFAPLTPAQIDWYVATGEPLDKAGGYHVDGRGALFIRSVAGVPSNVAGLPVELVYRLSGELGLRLGWPAAPRG